MDSKTLEGYNKLAIINDSKYNIKIDEFEGPLDLLLYLVNREELEIININIAEITEQYLEYLEEMKKLDLDIASEFVLMASQLIYLKSKKIIPTLNEEDNELSEEEFVKMLLEYKKYKDVQEEMFNRYNIYSKRFTRLPSKLIFQKMNFEKIYEIKKLSNAYEDVLEKITYLNNNKAEVLENTLNKKNFSIFSKVKEIYQILFKKKNFNFNSVFLNDRRTKNESITAFLSILELAKKNRIKIEQGKTYR